MATDANKNEHLHSINYVKLYVFIQIIQEEYETTCRFFPNIFGICLTHDQTIDKVQYEKQRKRYLTPCVSLHVKNDTSSRRLIPRYTCRPSLSVIQYVNDLLPISSFSNHMKIMVFMTCFREVSDYPCHFT